MITTLHVTRDCNFACTYCHAGRKVAVDMPAEVMRRAVDITLRSSADGPAGFRFMGGEPLLCVERIRDCVEYAVSHPLASGKPLAFGISTNGSLLTGEHCRFFALHGFSVGISIDGIEAAHDRHRATRRGTPTWTSALAALRSSLEIVPATWALMTVTPDTAWALRESVEFLYGTGVRGIQVSPDWDRPWPPGHLATFSRGLAEVGDFHYAKMAAQDPIYIDIVDAHLKAMLRGGRRCDSMPCSLGLKECAVAPSGFIYGCEGLVLNDDVEEYRIGHVSTGIDTRRAEELRRAVRQGDPKCRACRWRDFCPNACGCSNRLLSGDWHIVGETMCQIQQIEMAHAALALDRLLNHPPPLFEEKYRPWLGPPKANRGGQAMEPFASRPGLEPCPPPPA